MAESVLCAAIHYWAEGWEKCTVCRVHDSVCQICGVHWLFTVRSTHSLGFSVNLLVLSRPHIIVFCLCSSAPFNCQYKIHMVQCAACRLQCAVCSVHCVVWSVYCAICSTKVFYSPLLFTRCYLHLSQNKILKLFQFTRKCNNYNELEYCI